MAETQNSIPGALNFQNEIYSSGPPSLGRKHLLQQLWERPLMMNFCAEIKFLQLTRVWCEIKAILRWEEFSTFSSLHFVSWLVSLSSFISKSPFFHNFSFFSFHSILLSSLSVDRLCFGDQTRAYQWFPAWCAHQSHQSPQNSYAWTTFQTI